MRIQMMMNETGPLLWVDCYFIIPSPKSSNHFQEPPKKKFKAIDNAAAAQSPQPLEWSDVKEVGEDDGVNAAGPAAVSSPAKQPYVVRMPNCLFLSIAHSTLIVTPFSHEVGSIIHRFEY